MRKILRILMYIIGLGILSLGVVLNTKTGLGVSALNSVAYVLSDITELSLGTFTMIVYLVYIIAQIVLLRKEFKFSILLQLPCTLLFGKYTDFFNQLIQIEPDSIFLRLLLLTGAITFTALGVVLTVNMKIVPNAPDGLVEVLAMKTRKDFGYVKNLFDLSSVCVSVTVALVVKGQIIGIGVGTIASALLIGRLIALFNRLGREKLSILVVAPKINGMEMNSLS